MPSLGWLGGCATNNPDPALGGVFDTLNGLQSEAYARRVEEGRSQLQGLQSQQARQRQSLSELDAKKAQVALEKSRLQADAQKNAAGQQATQARIDALAEDQVRLVQARRKVEAAAQALGRSGQQASGSSADDGRIRELTTQRDALRQQLEALLRRNVL